MATNFNNKYLQVLQNYDEFGEYSADYVKGEDHVAFLIEENEVIYWLYLEQVWRPLNVRTTKTGELEDGRTKVAVRLEYVEGGQKYTSVPNIPDPERITSMSHFLENYPDIEEVNVNGTVNLTDLSYAFAGSKIKDFSMLDTSNVTNIQGIIDNVNDNELSISINYKSCTPTNSNPSFDNVVLNELQLHQLELNPASRSINIYNSTINKLIAIDQSINVYNVIINEIESNEYIAITHNNVTNRISQINNVTADEIRILPYALIDDNIINVQFNKLEITGSSHNYDWANKIVCLPNDNECTILFNFDINRIYSFAFGYGIDYNNLSNVILTVANDTIIGNFCFTVPIVNDEFINKYNNAKQISIFQYKTAFTEVADINISNEVDSNLLYINWDDINFDTTNMNIEINNNIDVTLYTNHYKTFKLNSNNKILSIYNDSFENSIADNLEITGEYILDRRIYYKNGMHDVIFHDNVLNIKDNILVEKNIKADNIHIIISNDGSDKQFDIDTLIENNIVNSIIQIELTIYNNDLYKEEVPIINYNSTINTIYILGNAIALLWYNYITKPNILHIKGEYDYGYAKINLFYETYEKNTNIYGYEDINNIYLYFESNTYGLIPFRIYENGNNKAYESFFNIQYINGIINIYLDEHRNNAELKNINYIHIDIEKVIPNDNSVTIIPYMNCDAETNINLITKLIDNTSSSSKTIYMYRSQANIIGEENIAAAVAKNYEFAIIEN